MEGPIFAQEYLRPVVSAAELESLDEEHQLEKKRRRQKLREKRRREREVTNVEGLFTIPIFNN
jgi:hypothetical protein